MKYSIYRAFIILLLFCIQQPMHCANQTHAADLIIFSYDRPLQLYALLESVDRYISGLNKIAIIYRTTSQKYQDAYMQVQHEFEHVQFIHQGANPKADFKPLLLEAIRNGSEHILFAVDDIIVTDYIDLTECIQALEQNNAYGFYLRLGRNIVHNYTQNCPLPMPNFHTMTPNIVSWSFKLNQFDAWNYPHTVDMALYRTKDIMHDLTNLTYSSPNSLEGRWHDLSKKRAKNKIGLCYEHSKMINIPLNRVQHEFNNKNMQLWSAAELLDFFNQNLKIDINLLYQYRNRSVHMDYEPVFILRCIQ